MLQVSHRSSCVALSAMLPTFPANYILPTCPSTPLLPHHPRPAAWIARQAAAGQAPCSPMTGLPLEDLSLRPNRALRAVIASIRAAGLLA